MRKYASLSASYLRKQGRQFHKFMKAGRLPKVIKACGINQ
mgnify:CR=1 FL=1